MSKPEVIRGMPFEEYQAIQAMSSGVLRDFHAAGSPAHWKYASENPREEKEHYRVGKALHYAVLEPDLFLNKVTGRRDMPTAADLGFADFRKKEAREMRDSIKAEIESEVAGYEVVLDSEQMERVAAMAYSLRVNKQFSELTSYEDFETELTLLWDCPETQLPCKARLDFYAPAFLCFGEIKTTGALTTVEGFGREILKRGYHIQAAHYLDGAQACGLKLDSVQPVAMAVVENSLPHISVVRPLDLIALEIGKDECRRAMRRLYECKRQNCWPGPDPDESWSLPGWYRGGEL